MSFLSRQTKLFRYKGVRIKLVSVERGSTEVTDMSWNQRVSNALCWPSRIGCRIVL